jgi:transcriptional regulator with XRE-family HTH domain
MPKFSERLRLLRTSKDLSQADFAKQIIGQVLENVYTKEEIAETLKEYITENQLDEIHEDLASKNYVDEELERLRKELEIYLQGY